MSVAVAVTSIVGADPSQGTDKTLNQVLVEGTLTLTGNYGSGASHGDAINFANATGGDLIKSEYPPRRVEIFENQQSASAGVGNAPLGYTYIYCQGTTQNNGLLQVLGAGAGGATTGDPEFTQGAAYSAGSPSLNNAVLRFRAWFPVAI